MAHRDPASPGWALAARSKALWAALAAAGGRGGAPLARALEWQATGSLLLATTADEVEALQRRAELLRAQGLEGVVLLSPRELKMHEPALRLPPGSHGLLVQSDAQINGKRTAWGLLDDCKALGAGGGAGGRLLLGLDEPVLALEPRSAGAGVDVVTSRRSRGGDTCSRCPAPGMPPLRTGMMELSYTQHYSAGGASGGAGGSEGGGGAGGSSSAEGVDITFTATTSVAGSLLIGSSREFSGWEVAPSADIVAAIMARATAFLPDLAAVAPEQLLGTTRVGLRPFALGGLPAVGRVPGLPGVAVAAGHEGSGLCLGPATAELAPGSSPPAAERRRAARAARHLH
ncbi:thiO [Scenedesmus sp. PABB004]|nr:thiO [Scenedesmus sp. PABB004]